MARGPLMLRLLPLLRLMPTTRTLPMPTDMSTVPTATPLSTTTARGPLMPELLPMPTDMPTMDTLDTPMPMPTATTTARGPLMPRLLPPLMLTTAMDMLPTLMDMHVDITDTPLILDTFINLLDNCIELRKMQTVKWVTPSHKKDCHIVNKEVEMIKKRLPYR